YQLSVGDSSSSLASVPGAPNNYGAVDQDVLAPLRILLRIIIGRLIGHRIGVEHDNVGPVTFFEYHSIFESKNLGGQRSHLANRVFELKDLFLSRVLP